MPGLEVPQAAVCRVSSSGLRTTFEGHKMMNSVLKGVSQCGVG
jgi:hypothetical protein